MEEIAKNSQEEKISILYMESSSS